jgi:hypothetical protein
MQSHLYLEDSPKMNGAANLSDTESSLDAASEAGSSASDDSEQPPYSIEELAAIFTDFYKSLATLHYDPVDLKMPPPQGWDTALFPTTIVSSKSEDVVALMQHLPYFTENQKSTHIHYKSKLVDYTDVEGHDNAEMYDGFLEDVGAWLDHDDDMVNRRSDLLVIAGGYESGGRTFILDVLRGEMIEDIIRCNTCGPVDVNDFLEDLKNKLRSLELIPCPGRETQETAAGPANAVAISEEEVRAQTEHWGTDLDLQFVRQVYRQYGWPHDFRRTEATSFIEDFMAQDRERREEWERAFH